MAAVISATVLGRCFSLGLNCFSNDLGGSADRSKEKSRDQMGPRDLFRCPENDTSFTIVDVIIGISNVWSGGACFFLWLSPSKGRCQHRTAGFTQLDKKGCLYDWKHPYL